MQRVPAMFAFTGSLSSGAAVAADQAAGFRDGPVSVDYGRIYYSPDARYKSLSSHACRAARLRAAGKGPPGQINPFLGRTCAVLP